MNSEKQTKEDFAAFIAEMNKKKDDGELDKLIIVTSAGLHLHYVKLDKSLTEEQAMAKANQMDEQWRADNKEILDSVKCELEILSWSEEINNQDSFKKMLEKIKSDYDSNKDFRDKVTKHSVEYHALRLYEKLKNTTISVELQDCEKAAIEYVLEECAALERFNELAAYLVYPGKVNPSFNYVYKKMFKSQEIAIQFKKYNLEEEKNENENEKTPSDSQKEKVEAAVEGKGAKIKKIKKEITNFLKNENASEINLLIEKINKLFKKIEEDEILITPHQEDTKKTKEMIFNKVKNR